MVSQLVSMMANGPWHHLVFRTDVELNVHRMVRKMQSWVICRWFDLWDA